MQHGITKNGVEFFVKGQRHSVYYVSIQAKFPRRIDKCGTRVDCNNVAANIRDLLGENAVAASEVKYALTGLRSQKL